MNKEFAFAICAALLMGAAQIAKYERAEASAAAREAHVSPKGTTLSAAAELAKPDPSTRLGILKSYGNLPLTFEENRGQIDPQVKFLSRSAGYTLFLTADEAVLSIPESKPNDKRSRTNRRNNVQEPPIVDRQLPSSESEQQARNQNLGMKLVGPDPHTTVSGVDELPGKSNYFIRNDPKKWRSNVPTYAKVKYEGVYSGIDLVYYGNQQQLEFDFVVAPGADPRRIQFDIRGAKRIRRDDDGDLVLKMEMREDEIRWHKPIAYQEKNGTRQLVAAHYAVKDENRVAFEVAGYDVGRPLYIDPLIYSTYLGGNGEDVGTGIAVDSAGNAYVIGTTNSNNFPTMNPLQPAFEGEGYDAFVVKINPTGSGTVYSTYFGGSGLDVVQGVAVDSSGNAYVTGITQSTDFPTMNPLQPAYGGGDDDAFVAKINPTGSALVYSTYLGGDENDLGYGIAVDSSGNAYVTGATSSTNFPTKNPLQPAYGGGDDDVFVTKINGSGSALVYSTYLGGNGSDVAQGVAVDSSGNAYVTGGTNSSNFPNMNPLQPAYGGGDDDAFVTKINPTGSALVYSTYLGGNGSDESQSVAVDSSGNAYVTGVNQLNQLSHNECLAASLQRRRRRRLRNQDQPNGFSTDLFHLSWRKRVRRRPRRSRGQLGQRLRYRIDQLNKLSHGKSPAISHRRFRSECIRDQAQPNGLIPGLLHLFWRERERGRGRRRHRHRRGQLGQRLRYRVSQLNQFSEDESLAANLRRWRRRRLRG